MSHPKHLSLTHQFVFWLRHPFHPIQTTALFVVVLIISVLLFVLLMALLHRVSPLVRKWVTIIFTFLAGSYYMLEYLWPVKHDPKTNEDLGNFLSPSISPVSDYINNIFIWSIFLGLISLSIVHGRKLWKRETGWHNSLAFFIAAIAMFLFGAYSHMGKSANYINNHWYNSLFNGLMMNFDSAMFALLAFYIVSAAYRAFRIRSMEAILLMISALVVMLGMVDFGLWLTHSIPLTSGFAFLRIESISGWILSWVNMPAQRAVMIGVNIGALAMALRLWLSLERGSFFSQE